MDLKAVSLPLGRLTLPVDDDIHLWLINTDGLPLPAARQEHGSDHISLHTKARDQRIRQQFVLRLLLGAYLNLPGKDVSILKTELGKPYVKDAPFIFNLSHCQNWFMLAIASSGEIGVDIEVDRLVNSATRLAKRCFSAVEYQQLSGLEEPERSKHFLKRWTATEAVVKAKGQTLAKSLASLVFNDDVSCLTHCPDEWPAAQLWSLRHFSVSDQLVGCVARPSGLGTTTLRHLRFS